MKKEIRIAGLGGQGVVFVAQLLGRAGVLEGWCVSQSSFYGPETRGTLCYGEVILSRESIDFPFVTKPDILLTLCQEGYDRFARETIEFVFLDSGQVKPDPSVCVIHFPIPAEELAEREVGKRVVANLVGLAACCAKTGIVKKESLLKALEEMTEGPQRTTNLKALELGWELGTRLIPLDSLPGVVAGQGRKRSGGGKTYA
jgi:2-oxoglutarate ferredoxin oxidoreductase subunit gamma